MPETMRMKKWGTNEGRTMREKCMDAHPTEDEPINQMPMPFNWGMDVNKSNGISPVVSMDTRPTEHVDKVTIPPPAIYGPCDLSTLCSGT